ncbi:MAG TPA: HIT family protein [Candidatus Methylomirabilis sp.]|nr:HIT family protein [Candidatus Methylomirabilis sp.]
MSCIFCQIVAGEIPADKIYEDEKCLAFLDIHPVNPGHALLIPKAHYQMMVDTPDDLIAYLFVKAKKLMPKIKKATGADYVSLSVVGVDVPHFHIHLIPRRFDDGLAGFWPTKTYAPGEMTAIAEKIRQEIKNNQ